MNRQSVNKWLTVVMLATGLTACQARGGSVTIDVAVGDLQDQSGALTGSNAVALLVADTSGLGLAGLSSLAATSSLAVGTQLTDSNGTSVAQIVGRFVIAFASEQNGLLTDEVGGLVVDPPLATGQDLWLMWFPSLNSSSTQPGAGTYFGVYRDPATNEVDLLDSGQLWVIPGDGANVTLQAISPGEGGITPQSDLMANYRTAGSAIVPTNTISVTVRHLEDQNGTITSSGAMALLVADTSGLGLGGLTNLAPNSSLAVGTQLTETNGTAIAQVVGRFTIAQGSGQNGALSDSVSGITLDPPLATGQNLWLLWFPSLTSASTQPGNATYFGVYRDPNTTPIDGGQPWVIPSDGFDIALRALSPSGGGSTLQSDLMAKYRTIASPIVPTNFGTVAGVYSGLAQSNAPSSGTTGFLTITVTGTRSFSAKLTLGGVAISFKGVFDGNGSYSTNLVTKSGATISITLQGYSVNGIDQIGGTISDGSFTSELIANRSVFDARSNPATQFQGYYTLFLLPDSAAADFPQGNGCGTLIVDAGGRAKLKGTLGDGTKISQTAVVSKDGSWPVFIPLYGKKGLLSGWVTFTNVVGVSDCDGTLTWTKPEQSSARLYRDGFTNTVTIEGARYTAPAAGTRALTVTNAACNLLATLGEGNLNSSLSNSVTLDVANKVSPCVTNGFKLTIVPATGLFSGSFLNPVTQKPTKFSGTLSQKQNLGAGFFLGTDQTGFVTLEPEP